MSVPSQAEQQAFVDGFNAGFEAAEAAIDRARGQNVDLCDFCHGKPLLSATSWLNGKPQAAACPRCGQ